MDKVDNLESWLANIASVCIGYDGYESAESLKGLIDDIKGMAISALDGKPPMITIEEAQTEFDDAKNKLGLCPGNEVSVMRKFRLRNGAVVKEIKTNRSVKHHNYSDEYIIVDPAGCHFDVGKSLVLALSLSGGLPGGGAHGTAYDIMEECEREAQ